MIRSRIVIGILLFCFIQSVWAQNAPVTSISSIGDAIPNQQISIRVFVKNFTNIGSASLYLDYDYSALHFVSATITPLLGKAGNYAIGDNDLGTGFHRIITGWYGAGSSLPDSTAILNITFTYISGSTSLNWFDNGPSCAYTDAAANFLIDSPYTTFYKTGKTCGTITSPGLISGNNTVQAGITGEVFSIDVIPGAKGYSWTLPSGAVITAGNNTNRITVDFSETASSGEVTVKGVNDCNIGPTAVLPVTILGIPTGIDDEYSGKKVKEDRSIVFELYPNPVKERFTMRLKDYPYRDASILILSANGSIVKRVETTILYGLLEREIDVSNLPSGLYLIVVNSGERKILRKIIKQ